MPAQIMRTVETFSTSRLTAERLRFSDLDEISRMNRDPRVMATLGGVMSDLDSRKSLSKNLEHWDRNGFGIWTLRSRRTNDFVGRAGLRYMDIDGSEEIELAYAIRCEFWGLGLATEVGREIVEVGKHMLDIRDVVAFTLPSNTGSRRVMEKAGFDFERNIVHGGVPHVLYRNLSR